MTGLPRGIAYAFLFEGCTAGIVWAAITGQWWCAVLLAASLVVGVRA